VTTTDSGPAEPVAWQPPPPLPTPKPRRWLVVATALWAGLLATAALWAIWHGQTVTDREQTTIEGAKESVDRAIAHVVKAGDDGVAVAEISDFTDLGGCHLTVARGGVRHERTVLFFTTAGTEQALLERIVAGLPVNYNARLIGGGLPRISADAGGFVALTGGVVGPGNVRLVADTGCRQPGGDLAERPATVADRAPAQAALTALGAGSAQWQDLSLPCPDGSELWVVRASAPQPATAQALPAALAKVATTGGIAVGPEAYAFHSGRIGVLVTSHDGALTVSATNGCSGG
jgi:hypothetical protein